MPLGLYLFIFQISEPCNKVHIGYTLRDRLSYVRESLKTPNNHSRKNVHFSPRLNSEPESLLVGLAPVIGEAKL